jgi:beta-mannosidase
MYNDCWCETGWTPIDYYLRRKPSYYWIKNACAPINLIVRKRGNYLITRVVNDTLEKLKLIVKRGWVRIDGSESKITSENIQVNSNSMLEIGKAKIDNNKMNPKEWIYISYLIHKNNIISSDVYLLKPYRELVCPIPDIQITYKGKVIKLVSKSYCHGVHYRDKGKAVLSDNYFDLLPGVPKYVTCLKTTDPGKIRFHNLFD